MCASLHHIQFWVVLPWARRCAPLFLFMAFQQVISPSKLCCFCIQRLGRQVFLAWPLRASHPLFSINLPFLSQSTCDLLFPSEDSHLAGRFTSFGVTEMQTLKATNLTSHFTSYDDPLHQGDSAPDVIILPRPGDIHVKMVLHRVARTASNYGSSW